VCVATPAGSAGSPVAAAADGRFFRAREIGPPSGIFALPARVDRDSRPGREPTARGQSPPDVFPRLKTSGFHGSCAPGIASLRSSRLLSHSLLTGSSRSRRVCSAIARPMVAETPLADLSLEDIHAPFSRVATIPLDQEAPSLSSKNTDNARHCTARAETHRPRLARTYPPHLRSLTVCMAFHARLTTDPSS